MPRRQLILVRCSDDSDDEGGMPSMGSRESVMRALSRCNCAPDGTGPEGVGETPGMATLHGPGFVLELPAATQQVAQVLVTLTDDDFSWPCLIRICRDNGWMLMDPDSGRTFGG